MFCFLYFKNLQKITKDQDRCSADASKRHAGCVSRGRDSMTAQMHQGAVWLICVLLFWHMLVIPLYPTLFTLHPRFRAFICDVWWVKVSIFCYLPMYRLFRGMNRLRLEYYLLTLFHCIYMLNILQTYMYRRIVHVNWCIAFSRSCFSYDYHRLSHEAGSRSVSLLRISSITVDLCYVHIFMDSSWIILILSCTTCNETYSMKAYNRFWLYLEGIFAVCLPSHVMIDKYDSKF